ncbi:hypothetical protein Esti_001970 [Eimeria stiedai]
MALLRLLLVAAPSLVLDSPFAAGLTVYRVKLADANTCLSDVNAARQDAGLKALTAVTNKFPGEELAGTILKEACEAVLFGQPFIYEKVGTTPEETYAFYKLNGENEPQCSAAVKQWQSGFSYFSESPPVTTQAEYSDIGGDALSFATIYNPDETAVGQCKVAVCIEGDTGTGDDIQKVTKEGSALLCLTSPNVFEKKPMFTQGQWDKIAMVVSSSASVAVPSVLAFAAVSAGIFSL